MIKVFHFRHGKEEGGVYNNELSAKVFMGLSKPAFTRENYRHVASVDTDDPEEAYFATNSIDEPWFTHSYIEVPAELQHARIRSTSVGDILELEGGKLLRCASAGWEEV
jgi:hypothetical protein